MQHAPNPVRLILFSKLFFLRYFSVQAKWTMTHAHYLQMGGFRVHCTGEERTHIPFKFGYRTRQDGVHEVTMSLEAFEKLLSLDLIDFPLITREEIEDKSRRDAASKAISLMQLVWFILQIAARARQHLAVTELELTTAALASFGIVMYLLWWHKPIDVLCPTIITTKDAEKRQCQRKPHTYDTSPPWCSPTPNPINEDAAADRWRFRGNFTIDLAGHCWHTFKQSLVVFACNVASPVKQSLRSVRELPQQLCLKFKNWREERSRGRIGGGRDAFRPIVGAMVLCGTVPCKTTLHIFLALIFYPIQAILASTHFSRWRTNLEATEIDSKSMFDVVFSRKHLRLMTEMVFSSEEVENSQLFYFSTLVGAVFGSIHCAAWNSVFPLRMEQILWRVSSLCLLGLCFLLLVCGVVYSIKPKRQQGWNESIFASRMLRPGLWVSTMWAVPVILYVVIRVCLLVLSITTLRALPPSAFKTVQWSEFIPHI